jgi:hypothetical protein
LNKKKNNKIPIIIYISIRRTTLINIYSYPTLIKLESTTTQI